jgi:signal transduction histidine kinase
MGTGWWPISLLPVALGDRVQAAIGGGPASAFPIRRHDSALGLLILGGEGTELGDSIGHLSDALAAWLGTAETAALALRLNEELVDINQRLVNSQAELARVRALAAAGDMAAGAAHELNNPLAVISGRAQLLDREDVPEDIRRTAQLIAEHAHKASEIVNELMDFAKPAAPAPETWSIAELFAEVRKEWLDRTRWDSKQFRLEVSDGSDRVHADRAQVRLLLDELLRNASDAMRESAEPLLIVNCRPDVADGKVVVTIRDNGCGMTPDVLEHAMTPFFSHRAAGRGRGLGLSRAARYAEINGGQIAIESRSGEGTVVTLELPAPGPR